MGKLASTQESMQVKATIFFCFALLVAIWAVTEVQELGNDDSHAVGNAHESANLDAGDDHEFDDDSVGESAGAGVGGRRGGFLSTTGSFQLSSGGNQAGNSEEDELGEGMGVGGRRGGFLSTTGSFQLSSSGNNNGNEEEF